ncbi:hypothetical protein APY94_12675 [Thermococcus celericrescens]|uniref:Uncharacterized protein n=1 Tax=Thermococcus celericrescens TaxID=227598 RepID=A0A100XVG6_9EURY|nr:ABC transporter permease [Thermococcus celericrescens]KUH31244.1 hypothetical protein APY94_12675 [Thermococcus celericrescens]
MGRVKEQLKWELEDPYVALIFVFSFVLLAVTFYTNLFSINANVMPMGLEMARGQAAAGTAMLFPGLSDKSSTIFAITGVLLASLTIRYDRDTRVAKSVYSLPIRNHEVILAKFITVFTVLFLSAFSAAFVAYIYAYEDSPGMIKEGMLGQRYLLIHLMYWLEASLYVSALSSLIALLSPGTFASILGGITVMYIPEILDWDFLPPRILNDGLVKAHAVFWDPGEKLSVFFNTTFYAGLLLPLVVLSLTLVLSEWRDVS